MKSVSGDLLKKYDIVKKMWDTHTNKQIAEACGCHVSDISEIAKNIGLSQKTGRTKPQLSELQRSYIDSSVIDYINRVAAKFTPPGMRKNPENIEKTRSFLMDLAISFSKSYNPEKSPTFLCYVQKFAKLRCGNFWTTELRPYLQWKAATGSDLSMILYLSFYDESNDREKKIDVAVEEKDKAEEDETKRFVLEMINDCLSEREKAVIKMFYKIDTEDVFLNFAEIAKAIGTSRNSIAQTHRSAIEKLREAIKSKFVVESDLI